MSALDTLDNLCGITDVNASPEPLNDVGARHGCSSAGGLARDCHRRPRPAADPTRSTKRKRTKGQPTMILARTLKGKGVSFVEGKAGWHGKPFKKGEVVDRALADGEAVVPVPRAARQPRGADSEAAVQTARSVAETVARPLTRWAISSRHAKCGTALAKLADAHRRRRARRRREELDVQRPVGAPSFYENLSEQVMVGRRCGLRRAARFRSRRPSRAFYRALPLLMRRSATSASSSPDRAPVYWRTVADARRPLYCAEPNYAVYLFDAVMRSGCSR
jgi:hypothetical protein